MKFLNAYAVDNNCYKSAMPMTPQGIVLNCTVQHNPYLSNFHGNPANVHIYIGYDGIKNKEEKITAKNVLPYNNCGWSCGQGIKGSYNYSPAYIQIMLLRRDSERYFGTAYRAAVKCCIRLCRRFSIPFENIISHAEAHAQGYADASDNLSDWMERFGTTMNDFRATVAAVNDIWQPMRDINDDVFIYKVYTEGIRSLGQAEALVANLQYDGYNAHNLQS